MRFLKKRINGILVNYRHDSKNNRIEVVSDDWAKLNGYLESRELMMDDSSKMRIIFNDINELEYEANKGKLQEKWSNV